MKRLSVRKSAAKPRSAKQDAVKMDTVVSLLSLHYLKATISYMLIGRKKDFVEVLLFILLIIFRMDHASEKMRANLAPCLYSISRTEMLCTFLTFWWEVFRAVSLGYSCVSLTVCSPRWVEADGCLQFWDLWGRLLHLLGLAQATRICWAETCSVPQCQGVRSSGRSCVWWMDLKDSTCCPSVGFSFQKSCYTLSIMKTVFQSEFLSIKTCNVLGNAFPQLWSQFMCIPACLLNIPGYPTYEQVLGPVVILGDSRFCWNLLKK